MELLISAADIFMNIDEYLGDFAESYGKWAYLILFTIIFAETGFVIMPLLPGDSMIFVTGTIAAAWDILDVRILYPLYLGAAILGDTLNYHIGQYLGPKVFTGKVRFLNQKNLLKTQRFYQKYGGITIVIARFIPVVRTFAPFIAGVAAMSYMRFLFYNVIGALIWVSLALFGGYFFGNLPFVQENYILVILGILGITFIPVIYAYLKKLWQTRERKKLLNDKAS